MFGQQHLPEDLMLYMHACRTCAACCSTGTYQHRTRSKSIVELSAMLQDVFASHNAFHHESCMLQFK